MSNTTTKPCPYKHHYVYPSLDGNRTIVAIDDGQGEGSFDLYEVSKYGVEEVKDLSGVYPTPYWIDRVSCKVIRFTYEFLDRAALKEELPENVIEVNFDKNDIPF